MCVYRGGKSGQIVAPLQNRNQSTRTIFPGQIHNHPGEDRKTLLRECGRGQWVVPVPVESSGDEQALRLKSRHGRDQFPGEDLLIIRVSDTGRQRDIECESRSRTFAPLSGMSAVGKE